MNAAQKVISKFGGQSSLAKMIGKGQSTVQHWSKTGVIPARWQPKLLDLAKFKGIQLSSYDFISQMPPQDNGSTLPIARWPGFLRLIESEELPCFVLDNGQRVITRTGATKLLAGGKGGGNLESYVNVVNIRPLLPENLSDRMIEFVLPGVTNKTVRGLTAEDFLAICRAYVHARDNHALTGRQEEIAIKASMFLSACAKVGLIALIDEATGYQYERQQDALQVKLKLYLEEEMRKWEKTFPDELWMEFGRLTGWQEPLQTRPKYWGKLVTELIYELLDPDVAEWLKEHVPEPSRGKNYHQWLSGQYGLNKLIQHIWMVIGIAKTCFNIHELREKLAIQFGRSEVQFSLFLPPPTRQLSPGKLALKEPENKSK